MLTLTPRAIEALVPILTAEQASLRVGILTGGCSGVQYHMGLDKDQADDDIVLALDGAQVLIDPQSAALLDQTVIDFVDGPQGQGFVFNNPAAAGQCSCSGGCPGAAGGEETC